MFKRYDLDVYYIDVPIYSASFSSINNMVKFACGFDNNVCDFHCIDVVLERSVPIVELMEVFRGDINGI